MGLWALSILLLIVPFNRVWGDFLIGGCAALLICLCLDRDRITAALVVPPALWLGRVSYSLYLIHLPILIFATTSGFGGIGRLPVFIVTLVLAELTYRLLEQPSRWIGIKISNVPGPPRRPI